MKLDTRGEKKKMLGTQSGFAGSVVLKHVPSATSGKRREGEGRERRRRRERD